MATLLIAEHDNASVKDSTNKALTAASQMGGDVHVLVAGGGEGTKAAAEAAAKLAGVKKVLVAVGDAYANDLAEPLAALIYTDIATDGMLAGPNVVAMREMLAAVSLPLVASGGVTTAEDVAALAQTGVAGCIIGRSLYEGRLTLADARRAASQVMAK